MSDLPPRHTPTGGDGHRLSDRSYSRAGALLVFLLLVAIIIAIFAYRLNEPDAAVRNAPDTVTDPVPDDAEDILPETQAPPTPSPGGSQGQTTAP